MIIKALFSGLLFIGLLCNPVKLIAQVQPEDVALVTDDFQDAFYESLKQKGIENYDRAITSLQKCIQLQPNNAAVYNELGRNYLAQKNYENARQSFEKATQLDPKNRWYWSGLYDVYYQTKDYEQSIIVVNKLIEFNFDYRDDLVSLYMYTQQFDKALALINELDKTTIKSPAREMYKLQILSDAKYRGSEKDNLENLIKKNPNEESNYISLIYLYSESNQEEKAYEVAKQLEKKIPESDWAQVSLFKFHLNNNDAEKAIKAMNQVLGSRKVDKKIKHRVLNEFLIYADKNPGNDEALDKAIRYFENEKEVQVAKEVAKYYLNKKNTPKAIHALEMNLEDHAEDMETMLLLLQLYTDNGQFDVVSKKGQSMIDLFPLQPELYYYVGLANNQAKNFKKAKEFLEMGLDYVVENKALEINFNIQLGEAYNGLGDTAKKEKYFLKADQLLKQNKK
ncbi:tetratricopeptide repeat protein [Flavobacterium sp. '19STA2R22 D10 B1']|uniref:tetratricopeptide repeat protein n=1 Tax=Flavobacterium aerium TaxID=3037261 RepID=UPI00278C20D5|nr:tetratricopeptide repeat protein [Flavobacterium sp. '19STA2R22 D10 B1']